LFQGPAQLGVMRLANQVVALVVEGGVEEEALVLELEVLVLLANAPLAQGHQLLALRECAYRYGPFLECDRHLLYLWRLILGLRCDSGTWESGEPLPFRSTSETALRAGILEHFRRFPKFVKGVTNSRST